MLIFGCNFDKSWYLVSEILDKNMLAKWCISVDQFDFAISIICLLDLLHKKIFIHIDKGQARLLFVELSQAEVFEDELHFWFCAHSFIISLIIKNGNNLEV